MPSFLRVLLVSVSLFASLAFAQTPTPAANHEARDAELRAASKAADEALIVGPKVIDIRDQAKFSLPTGMGWIPSAQGARLLHAFGSTIDESTLAGVVVPTDGKGQWLDIIMYVSDGYVRDDDAREWKADDILKSLREGTENGNAARREKGIPELDVTGWAQPPLYDSGTHRLVWAARVIKKPVDGVTNTHASVNYRTTALGRDGFLATTLVTDESLMVADKPVADQILAGLTFVDGKRYADFNEKTDRVAEYGLAALVAGVAAKKLGLLAIIAAFVAKFAKVGLLALLGAGAAFRKFFKRKPKPVPAPAPASAPVQQTPVASTASPSAAHDSAAPDTSVGSSASQRQSHPSDNNAPHA